MQEDKCIFMSTSNVILDIIKKYGSIINLDEKPEIMLEILQKFGGKQEQEDDGGGAMAAIGSVVGKALGVLGMKKNKASSAKKKATARGSKAEKVPGKKAAATSKAKASSKKAATGKSAASPKAKVSSKKAAASPKAKTSPKKSAATPKTKASSKKAATAKAVARPARKK